MRNAVRDLAYHDEMLSLLRLPEQANKDAVMILHMGGVFGDKAATLDRFRANYAKLSPSIKARLVLENDDVSWTVHDLLPVCEELNIPLVLDFHHHNIMFDKDQLREGTHDIMGLFPRIKATWDRKGITQKMHYSEPCPEAITGRQRRKHRPRVQALPPCADTMDLMIEAKDKEQAVFELMRTYRLPGWDLFNDIVPYERDDENRPAPKAKAPKKKRMSKKGGGRGRGQRRRGRGGGGGAAAAHDCAGQRSGHGRAPEPRLLACGHGRVAAAQEERSEAEERQGGRGAGRAGRKLGLIRRGVGESSQADVLHLGNSPEPNGLA